MAKVEDKKHYHQLKSLLEMRIQYYCNSFIRHRASKFNFTAKAYRINNPSLTLSDIDYCLAEFSFSNMRRSNELLDELRVEYEGLLQTYRDLLEKDNTKIRNFYFKWLHGLDYVLEDTPYEYFRRKDSYDSLFGYLPMILKMFNDDDIPRRVNDLYLRLIIEKERQL